MPPRALIDLCAPARRLVSTGLRTAAAVLLAFPLVATAATYKAAQLSDDRTRLRITTTEGEQFDAPRLDEQVEFDQPRLSADGRHVGWLALFPNCCTSYPIPLKLVVLDQQRQQHSFVGMEISIFAWCFVPKSSSVAYWQGVLHGSEFRHYEWRNIADGRLLGAYEYPHNEAANARARQRAPAWVRCVPE